MISQCYTNNYKAKPTNKQSNMLQFENISDQYNLTSSRARSMDPRLQHPRFKPIHKTDNNFDHSQSVHTRTQYKHQPKHIQQDRLTNKQIETITRSLLKDKTAHYNNVGVLTNVKGKMYCLKLGTVSKFKQFSHYFYASQYRRKFENGYKNNHSKTSKWSKNGKLFDQININKLQRDVNCDQNVHFFGNQIFNNQQYNQQTLTLAIRQKYMNKGRNDKKSQSSVCSETIDAAVLNIDSNVLNDVQNNFRTKKSSKQQKEEYNDLSNKPEQKFTTKQCAKNRFRKRPIALKNEKSTRNSQNIKPRQ